MPEDAKPRVLAVSLNHRPGFDSMYSPLLTRIGESSRFQRVKKGQTAIRLLQESPRPTVVLITDEALTLTENTPVWDAVLQYVRQGGRAVIMGHFPYFAKPLDLGPFFAKAGLRWEQGSQGSQVVESDVASKPLPTDSPKKFWYLTTVDPALESTVFPPDNVRYRGESPVMLARIGEGKLGYVGDVTSEEEYNAAVITLCGL